jgi:hypothetical protein
MLLQEAADCPGERGDDCDRVDLHEDVEDSSVKRDRIMDRRGDGQQLSRGPENGAAERLDLPVCWEWRSSRNAAIAQNRSTPTVATMIVTRWPRSRRWVAVAAREDVAKLTGSRPQHSKRHRSIVPSAADVRAVMLPAMNPHRGELVGENGRR